MVLSRKVKYGYGVGHVFNDLCASMWFTYLLVYLQYVLRLDRGLSGFFLMLGQVADALATPLIGLQSDRGLTFYNYGRRKFWHAIGTVCVIISFPFIFMVCGACWSALGYAYIILIAFMICVFQFGWASVQVSHLALIPDLTSDEAEREELNLIRYILDVASDVLVYLVAWIVLAQSDYTGSRRIDPGDAGSFKVITVTVLIIGTFFTIVFHALTHEPANGGARHRADYQPVGEDGEQQTEAEAEAEGEETRPRIQMEWRDWLHEKQFYQVSMLYAMSRLVANLANIYMPIFLQETLHTRQELIAVVPLVMSLSGVGASFLLRLLRKVLGKKSSLVVGIVIGMVASTISAMRWMPEWLVYFVAVMWGTCSSLMVVLSLVLAATLIAHNTDSSAFVYGSMSFTDKIVNGVAVVIIQALTKVACNGDNCSNYYRTVMSVGIFIPLIVAFIAVCFISQQKLGRTRKITEEEEVSTSSTGSDASDILLASPTPLGYGSITKV